MLFNKNKNNYTDRVNFNVKTLEKGHWKTEYKDVPLVKCPFDYFIYQMIIWEVKPDLIVEIGSNRGGSALYLSDLLDLNGKGVVHTIDINNATHEQALQKPNIKFFYDGFENYEIPKEFITKNILVIDDGSHYYDDVKKSLVKFKDFISLNSYFIIEDGILDNLGWTKQFKGGPNKAIKEFIIEQDNFIIDRKWCDLYGVNATFNTNGYLKRIK